MASGDSNQKFEEEIFCKLLDVVPNLMVTEAAGRSHVPGLMDLHLDVLDRSPEKLVIALSHYYKHPSGDMIPDPDMEIAVFVKEGRAEALAYQDCFGFHSLAPNGQGDQRIQRALNRFLSWWLGNLIEQGHCIQQREPTASRKGEGHEQRALP